MQTDFANIDTIYLPEWYGDGESSHQMFFLEFITYIFPALFHLYPRKLINALCVHEL